MTYTKVIFERLTSAYFPVVKYFLRKQKEITYFDNENSAKNKDWVKRLIREGKISEILPTGYVYNECYGTALDNVESIYKYFTGHSILAKEMIKIYGDENIGLAYKKEITRELSEFYYINSYLHDEESQLADNERILFIPYRYHQYLRLAEKSGAFYHNHRNIDIAHGLSICNRICGFGNKAKAWFLQSGIIAFYLMNMVSRKGSSRVKEYKYAILIRNPDYQFKFKNRPVDFLLDGNKINRDNTIFMLLNPAITRDNWDEIQSKKLSMIDCSKRFISSPGFNKETIDILRRLLPYTIKNLLLGLLEHRIILEVNNTLLLAFLKWSSILRKANFKHSITLNDEGIEHIGRNILLNKTGAKTWYYAHSASLGYISRPPVRHWLWSFLYYDYYVSWNKEMIEYYKLHPQKINDYLSIGCIWSQSIVDILEGRVVSNFKKETFPNFEKDKYKTLSFFDSSYLPNAVSSLEDGVSFYRCLLELLEEFPHILAIVKEKKPEENVLTLYESFGGTSEVFYKQYKPALDELRRHPRCHVTGYKGDPSEIIAVSDLTITYAFSSSTVEALCARKKAIFFDPGNKWRGCYYDKIPNFVAHNYDELKNLVHYWLDEVTDKDFEDFLNTCVKDEMDPYLDGKAINRFRKLISE